MRYVGFHLQFFYLSKESTCAHACLSCTDDRLMIPRYISLRVNSKFLSYGQDAVSAVPKRDPIATSRTSYSIA